MKSRKKSVATKSKTVANPSQRGNVPVTSRAQSDESQSPAGESESEVRNLFVFEAGTRVFAVSADEVVGTAEHKVPARLPRVPPAILGVVCVRGRMLTVLDARAFVKEDYAQFPGELPIVVVLRGDEQVALAADRQRAAVQVSADEIRADSAAEGSSPAREAAGSPILGVLYRNSERILVLDAAGLFAAALGRVERRRRRILESPAAAPKP